MMRRVAWSFLFVLFLSSCSATKKYPGIQQEPETTVRVENQNWLEMNVFILYSSQRIRLGMVRGLSTSVFVIPAHLIKGPTSLKFLADPVGGREREASFEITVSPGDEVEMVIPN